ncbi:MAG: three-Cys-motif partner protein TcmP [Acidobacteriota bacterium]
MRKKKITREALEQQLVLPMPLPEKIDTFDNHTFQIEHPIWTQNKALLIARYLEYFCYVTHHGTYIDGFAGPQRIKNPEMWSAKLVLEYEPKRLKNFFLFEIDSKKVDLLEQLKKTCLEKDLKQKLKRRIEIFSGDCNTLIPEFLSQRLISKKEATFCLLDQRTFECHWSTVKALANYEKSQFKIELFYFLAEAWLNRAIKAIRNFDIIEKWWGRTDWQILSTVKSYDRARIVCDRMKSELGYKSVVPWPIYAKKTGGRIQYFMLHATDHPEAPSLMNRAYKKAVSPREASEQLNLFEDEN